MAGLTDGRPRMNEEQDMCLLKSITVISWPAVTDLFGPHHKSLGGVTYSMCLSVLRTPRREDFLVSSRATLPSYVLGQLPWQKWQHKSGENLAPRRCSASENSGSFPSTFLLLSALGGRGGWSPLLEGLYCTRFPR